MIDERWDTWHRYHLITADDRPVAVVSVRITPHGEAVEATFTDGGRWTASDLLGRVPDEPTWRAEQIDRERVDEHLAMVVQQSRHQTLAELSAGYAVFRRWADVLDFDSAREVVRRLEPGHEVAVPISEDEWNRLERRISSREAVKRHEEMAAYTYFAVFDAGSDVGDLYDAFSVIRRPADESGPLEVFLRDGEWPATTKPHRFKTRAIGLTDMDRITQMIATAVEPRYFDVRAEGDPLAVVRFTGTTEETARDLGWEPSDLLKRWRGEPTWTVTEVTESVADMSRFSGALLDRAAKWRPAEYFAVFSRLTEAFDLDNAVMVVRRKDGVAEKFVGRGEWAPTDRISRLETLAEPPIRHLPISQEEMERLTRDRPGRTLFRRLRERLWPDRARSS